MTDLGTTSDGAIALDVDQLIGSHMAVVANSGGGKSWTIRKMLELAAGGPQRIVLDVEDEFYTLRERAPQLVIAGGENGDCPATVANAAALALFVLEAGVDVVVQLNDLGLDGQRAFIAQFLHTIVGAPKSLWHPALIVVDEAQRYAPQDGAPLSLPAITSLIGLGRKRGFTAVLASHRLSQINKDVTGHVNNWLLGRVGQSIDRRAVSDALGFRPSSDEGRGLARLKAGQFWGFGPAIADEPALIQVGRTETTHLKHGQHGVPMPPAPAEIRAMMAKLAAASVQPVSPSPDATNGEAKSYVPDSHAIDAARADGYAQGYQEGGAGAAAAIRARLDAIQAGMIDTEDKVGRIRGLVTDLLEFDGVPALATPAPSERPRATAPSRQHSAADPAPRRAGTVDQRILDALAELDAIGAKAPDRELVALLAGYKNVTSKGFSNALGSLRSDGKVDYPNSGQVALTAEGRTAATPSPAPLTSADLQRRILAILGGQCGRVLQPLIKAYPGTVDRGELAGAAGYTNVTSKGFSNTIGRLRTLGFIDYPGSGRVVALPVLFVQGRRWSRRPNGTASWPP